MVIGGGDEKLGLCSGACGFEGHPAATAARSAAAWAAATLEVLLDDEPDELDDEDVLDEDAEPELVTWCREAVVAAFTLWEPPELMAMAMTTAMTTRPATMAPRRRTWRLRFFRCSSASRACLAAR
jgi:hypothetical protein